MADFTKNTTVDVKAEQFLAASLPWPAGVDEDPQLKGFHYFSSPTEGPMVIQDGDWVVTDEFGDRFVLTNATFQRVYSPK